MKTDSQEAVTAGRTESGVIRILHHRDAEDLVTRKATRIADAERTVAPILRAVRTRGDAALLEYARQFDSFKGTRLVVSAEECHAALEGLGTDFLCAVETACENIRAHAETQLPRDQSTTYPDGRRLGWIVRPLDSMGAYIPSGRYPLPSTLLMTVIPAQVAGVKTVCIACPRPSAEILGLAAYLNVPHVFRMGGAQAIAALAYGTET